MFWFKNSQMAVGEEGPASLGQGTFLNMSASQHVAVVTCHHVGESSHFWFLMMMMMRMMRMMTRWCEARVPPVTPKFSVTKLPNFFFCSNFMVHEN